MSIHKKINPSKVSIDREEWKGISLFAFGNSLLGFDIMSKKINYISGQRINKITYVKDIEPYIKPNGEKVRKALFICPFCQEEFETTIANIKSGNTKSCGCYRIQKMTTHGLSKHPLHIIWAAIKNRCYNPNDQAYKHYGGRGIIICKEWRNNFKAFYGWCIINGYKEGLEIDRRNNDGNYTPENCRFVNEHIQNTNQRIRKTNKSGFTGVYWSKKENKWQSGICINKKRIHLGSFKKKPDAVQARNDYIIKNNLTEYKIQ